MTTMGFSEELTTMPNKERWPHQTLAQLREWEALFLTSYLFPSPGVSETS